MMHQIHYEVSGAHCVSMWISDSDYKLWCVAWKPYVRTLYVVHAKQKDPDAR